MKYFMLFLVFSSPMVAQDQSEQNNIDHLEEAQRLLEIQSPTSAQLDSLIHLAGLYTLRSIDTCKTTIEHILKYEKDLSPLQYAQLKYYEADVLKLEGDHQKSITILDEIYKIAKGKDKILESSILQVQGANLELTSDFTNSIDKYLKAADILIEMKNETKLADLYSSISGIFFDINELQKALEYNTKIKVLGDKLKSDVILVDALGMKASISMTKGIHYYLENELDSLNIASTLDTLYFYFDQAEKEFEQGLQLSNKITDKRLKLSLLNNYVSLTLNMENYEKAERLSLEAVQTAEEIGIVDLIIQSKINLSSYYRRTGNLKLSKKHAEESLTLAKNNGLERKEYLAASTLQQVYFEQKDYENAYYSQEFIRSYEQSINKTKRIEALANAENKFQAAVKEKENIVLKNKNEKVTWQRNASLCGAAITGLFLLLLYRFIKLRKEKNDKIEFTKAILFTQEEERKAIARDLHDGIGQSLLLIKKQLEGNQKTNVENSNMISETLEEVREISRGLHPFQLDKFGLTNTIKDVLEKIKKSTSIFVTSEIDNIDGLIDGKSEIHIYRIVQEALNNIVKHSEATAAKVAIKKEGNHLNMSIQDNGKGFDTEMTISTTNSLGLKTMSERVLSIGGKLKIGKNENNLGTQLNISIPY